MKEYLRKILPHFAYFYSKLGKRIFLMLTMSLFVGLMDGLGLAMFLPLLEMVSAGAETVDGSGMGNFAFLLDMIQAVGLSLNINVILAVMVIFFAIKGGFKFLEIYLNVAYRNMMIRKIRIELVGGLSRMKYDHFVDADAGRIQNTLSGEIERLTAGFQNYMNILQQSIMVLVYISLAFMSNPEFTVLVAIGGIVTNVLFRSIFRRTKKISRELTKVSHGFQGLLIQQVAFFKYLKATGKIQNYASKLVQRIKEIEIANRKMGVLGGILQGLREPILIGVIAVVILIQVNVLGGDLGLIILSILFFYRALTSVMQIQTAYNQFLERSGSIENVQSFTLEMQQSQESKSKDSRPYSFQKEIRLEKVCYRFSSGAEVLRDIDLNIRKNETVAFIGESGSGKTTLVNIITALLEPKEGRLMVDGVDSNELDLRSFQNRIGYITQDPVIFDDTVYHNVSFWEEGEDAKHRFWAALEKARIADFVKSLPDKEHSRLGNNGINLSGGQKQRISIARELFKDIELLVMDEATSALDSETERDIQQSIDALKGKLTIIMIAHRLSTIKNADRVVLMKEGRIERIGHYDELMGSSASFRKMVELQEL